MSDIRARSSFGFLARPLGACRADRTTGSRHLAAPPAAQSRRERCRGHPPRGRPAGKVCPKPVNIGRLFAGVRRLVKSLEL